jgi:hypothetical protein
LPIGEYPARFKSGNLKSPISYEFTGFTEAAGRQALFFIFSTYSYMIVIFVVYGLAVDGSMHLASLLSGVSYERFALFDIYCHHVVTGTTDSPLIEKAFISTFFGQ